MQKPWANKASQRNARPGVTPVQLGVRRQWEGKHGKHQGRPMGRKDGGSREHGCERGGGGAKRGEQRENERDPEGTFSKACSRKKFGKKKTPPIIFLHGKRPAKGPEKTRRKRIRLAPEKIVNRGWKKERGGGALPRPGTEKNKKRTDWFNRISSYRGGMLVQNGEGEKGGKKEGEMTLDRVRREK